MTLSLEDIKSCLAMVKKSLYCKILLNSNGILSFIKEELEYEENKKRELEEKVKGLEIEKESRKKIVEDSSKLEELINIKAKEIIIARKEIINLENELKIIETNINISNDDNCYSRSPRYSVQNCLNNKKQLAKRSEDLQKSLNLSKENLSNLNTECNELKKKIEENNIRLQDFKEEIYYYSKELDYEKQKLSSDLKIKKLNKIKESKEDYINIVVSSNSDISDNIETSSAKQETDLSGSTVFIREEF